MIRKKHIRASICGHKFPSQGRLQQNDGQHILEYNFQQTTFCIRCMWNFRTLCTWCCERVLLGEAVTLYTPTSSAFSTDLRYEPTLYTLKPLRFIGCLRCADDPQHAAGIWCLDWRQRRLYVDRLPNKFDTEHGTIEVSPVTRWHEPEQNTGRRLIAPISLVGKPISRQYLQDMLADIKREPVRIITP